MKISQPKVFLSKQDWMQPKVKILQQDRSNVKIHITKGVSKVVLSKRDWMQPVVKLFKKDGENVKIHITKAVSKVVLNKLDCIQPSVKLFQQDLANHLIRQEKVTNVSEIVNESIVMDVGNESMIERDITRTKIVSSILEDLLEKVNNSTSTEQIGNKNIENRPNCELIDLEEMFYSFDSDENSSDEEFFTPNTSIKEDERDKGYEIEDIEMFKTVGDQHEEGQNDFEDTVGLTKISMMEKEENAAPSILLIPPVTSSVHLHQISSHGIPELPYLTENTIDNFAGNLRRESMEMGEGSSAGLASRGPGTRDEVSDNVGEGSVLVSPGRGNSKGKGSDDNVKRISNKMGWGFFCE